MKSIFVDPIIHTIPSTNDVKIIEEWLTTLDAWLDEALISPGEWKYSLKAINHLREAGLFPEPHLLRKIITRYGLEFNIAQFASKLRNITNVEPDDQQRWDIDKWLVLRGYIVEAEEDTIEIIPKEFSRRWPKEIKEDMLILFATVTACKCMKEASIAELHIATSSLSQGKRQIQVSAAIRDSIPELKIPAPKKIKETLPLLYTPDDIPQDRNNIILLWDRGESGVCKAVKQAYRRKWQSQTPSPLNYRFAPKFFESIRERRLHNNIIVLNKIVESAAAVIADKAQEINGYKLHPLRKSKTADAPQLTRNNGEEKAWRIDISSSGPAWRLHYWHMPQRSDCQIEFVNVQRESEPPKVE